MVDLSSLGLGWVPATLTKLAPANGGALLRPDVAVQGHPQEGGFGWSEFRPITEDEKRAHPAPQEPEDG